MKVDLTFKLDNTREVGCGTDTTSDIKVIQEWIDTLQMALIWLAEGERSNAIPR